MYQEPTPTVVALTHHLGKPQFSTLSCGSEISMSFRRDIQTTAFVQTWVRLILSFKCITLLQAAPWVPRFIGFHHCRYVCRLYVPSLAKCSACTCLHRPLWLEDVKSSSGGAKGRSQIESLGHGVLIEKLKTRSD